MTKTHRVLTGLVALAFLLAGSVACAPKRDWPRPRFSGSNCGMPSRLSSLVLEGSGEEVATAMEAALQKRDWQARQQDGPHLEALYWRTATEPEATKWLPGPHDQYLVVIVTPVDSKRSTVTFMMSEYEPRADEGTSFALTAPEKFIDDFEGVVQDARSALRVETTSSAGSSR